MSLVVSDTGPVHYLVLTNSEQLLPELFQKIIIPFSVLEELRHEKTPGAVREWANALPQWVSVERADPVKTDVPLDPGELEAISLAMKLKAGLLLIDEKSGRGVARRLHLRVIGTIGILEQASERGLIDFEKAMGVLRATNFHLSDAVLDAALKRHARKNEMS